MEKLSNMGEQTVELSKYKDLKKKYRELEQSQMQTKNSFLIEKSENETLKRRIEEMKN